MDAPPQLYDCIVIGAGSAGCAAAARVSARGHKVLLLEAGGGDWNPAVHIPLLGGRLVRSGMHGWGMSGEPSPGLGGRRIPFPRGRIVGGTSAINGMVYVRGNADDYDRLGGEGAYSWRYADVLPYFKRSERHVSRRDDFHGIDGPLLVSTGTAENPLYSAFLEAAGNLGFPATDDFNGKSQEGFGRYDFTIGHGRRQSAARFLKIADRQKLTLLTRARALRIVIECGRAAGVVYECRGRQGFARAHEIILSAGAIHSPHVLMLSGIGDPAQLAQNGIETVHALPGVGKNMHDHVRTLLHFACRAPITLFSQLRADRLALALGQAILMRNGPAVEFPAQAGGFSRVSTGECAPDMQWYCFLGGPGNAVRWPGLPDPPGAQEFFMLGLALLCADSVGEVRLRSRDPRDLPLIFPNLLTEQRDVERLVEASRMAEALAHDAAFSELNGGRIDAKPKTRAEWRDWVRGTAVNSAHPVGTCRMGEDALAVVDYGLKVRGLAGLRVADASIFPATPRGNTNAPAIMVGERVADFVCAGG